MSETDAVVMDARSPEITRQDFTTLAVRAAAGEDIGAENIGAACAAAGKHRWDFTLLVRSLNRRAFGLRTALPPEIESRLAEINRQTDAAVEALEGHVAQYEAIVQPLHEERQRLLGESGDA